MDTRAWYVFVRCVRVYVHVCRNEEEEEICLFNIVCSYTNSAMLITMRVCVRMCSCVCACVRTSVRACVLMLCVHVGARSCA